MNGTDWIFGRIQALEEKLALMPSHPLNMQKRADREQSMAILRRQLEDRERLHLAFLAHRSELLARNQDFSRTMH